MRKVLGTLIGLAVVGVGCVSTTGVDSSVIPPQVAYNRPSDLPRRFPRDVHPPPRKTPFRPSYDSPAWYPARGKISPRWTTIVIHHSATAKGGAKTFDRFHRRRGWDELGYHFVIGNGTDTPDGAIEVGPRWRKQKHGAHCKTPDNYYNDHGIGICLVGDFTKTSPTQKQLASLRRLLGFLSNACHILPNRITRHGTINHKTKCPGQHFAIGPIRRSLTTPLGAAGYGR